MEVTKTLIKNYFEDNCTQEEAAIVSQYLLEHPEVMEEWLPEQEWETFEGKTQLSTDQSNRWYAKIEQEKGKKYGRLVSSRWLRIAVAAVIAGILLSVYLFVQPPREKEAPLAAQPHIPANHEKRFYNNSQQIISHVLDDGSIVTLHPNSLIICNQPFEANGRNITLQGEALFRVAKDSTRPFVVYAKGFSTTALGTTFRIKAYDNSKTAFVKLVEGKIVLKQLTGDGQSIYLKPGEECKFLQGQNTFQRVIPKIAVPVKLVEPIPVDSSITESKTEIIFSNTDLPVVLKKISEIYKVSINTDSVRLEGRKFTGSFLRKQAADDVLSTVTGLNNFTILYDGKVYRLGNQ
jgi:ferric-dicitrate binding protein FerR (iron transport regulator)